MSNIDKQALREAANAANSASWGNWESYKPHKGARGYEVKVGSKAVAQHCLKVDSAFIAAANPATVLALLDELEAKDVQIANLTAERDALREGEMGDAKHSNTRAAADIYFQLVEECGIPAGGSLVEYVSELRERAAMLQSADGNSPVIPDGWVACSERLPENKPGSYEYLVFEALNNGVHHDYWNVPDVGDDCQFTPFWNHYDRYVTHWMPLPAAPQQEVTK